MKKSIIFIAVSLLVLSLFPRCGVAADAPARELTWNILSPKRVGCQRFRFGGIVTSLVAEPVAGQNKIKVTINSDGRYKLRIKGLAQGSADITPGSHTLVLDRQN